MTLAGTIIVKLILKEKSETPSGILLPNSMVEEKNIGRVLYVGTKKGDMEPEVAPGDVVVFNYKSHRKQGFILEGQEVDRIGFEDVYLIQKQQNLIS